MTSQQRNIAIAVLLAFSCGFMLGAPPSRNGGPVQRFVSASAKRLLWLSLAFERKPEPVRTVRAEIGDDGYVQVDHGRGW